jgi:hypothetical protein
MKVRDAPPLQSERGGLAARNAAVLSHTFLRRVRVCWPLTRYSRGTDPRAGKDAPGEIETAHVSHVDDGEQEHDDGHFIADADGGFTGRVP